MGTKLIQSYVCDKFMVSTIHRESSASVNPPLWFYETLGWEWDTKTKRRGKWIIEKNSGNTKARALKSHFGICHRLANKELIQDEILRN